MKKQLRWLLAAGIAGASLTLLAQTPTEPAKAGTTTSPGPAGAEATVGGNPNGEIQPLITFDDTPLPNVINLLGRQAGINFQFDPKILNGTPGPDGKVPPPASISIRWENVTALQALTAVLDNNNLQLNPDPRTKIYRITLKDGAALEPLITKVVQLQYAAPTNIVTVIQPTLSARSKILADIRTGQLVVVATEKEMDGITNLLARLDSPTKQILIEAKFIETSQNPKTSKGINWTGTLQNQNVRYGNTTELILPPQAPTASTPLYPGLSGGQISAVDPIRLSSLDGFAPGVGFINADGVNAVLSFLNAENDAESIATPRAVTLENQPADLSVVRNIPVFEEQQGANTGGSVSPNTVKPNYNLLGPNGTALNEVGIKFTVTPRIFGVSNVFLDLKPELSEVESAPATTTLSGKVSTAPIFARRKLNTTALCPSGDTLVLGGLVSNNSLKNNTKVPILGDIPGLGAAFRSSSREKNKRNLVIFVTPTILIDGDYQNGEKSRNFLKTPNVDKDDPDWNSFDNAEAIDWSKPQDKATKK
ncbi:MAG: Type and secretion system protein [Verrucomicrobiales bacterium]|nr:Type and secretion system protein [Verrucomicrobiales bacterium]MDB6128971.1 Type and secretion system protein [Verrucomicrobiales bacterium]